MRSPRVIVSVSLSQVSEEYTLHRQTFYLAQDYFDRFMLTQSNIDKNILQLIGITCLFIAAKMEVRSNEEPQSCAADECRVTDGIRGRKQPSSFKISNVKLTFSPESVLIPLFWLLSDSYEGKNSFVCIRS